MTHEDLVLALSAVFFLAIVVCFWVEILRALLWLFLVAFGFSLFLAACGFIGSTLF